MSAPHQARKRFGQNFLTDHGVIEAIVRAIAPRSGENMVEIGPGLAAMTQPLVERLGRLTVVELDRDLAVRLRQHAQLQVLEADVLKVDFAQFGERLRVVGNLPYNISSPILFHLLPFADRVVDQHFMLQKEVVNRMAATADAGDYGRLSVMLQWRYDVEWLFDVAPEAFSPPPRVTSAIVRMTPLPNPVALDFSLLEEMVQMAFSQRRKLLRHTLGRWLDQRGFSGLFDVQRRAEEVPVAEYLTLAQQLSQALK